MVHVYLENLVSGAKQVVHTYTKHPLSDRGDRSFNGSIHRRGPLLHRARHGWVLSLWGG